MPVADLTARRLQARLATEQVRGRLPSVVAAVTRDGVLQWRGSHGDHTGSAAATHDLQYRIGSITKTMTAVLVMQLRDAGLLSLTDPLERHLPGTAYGERTLGELLSHSAGLPSEPPGPWWERVDGSGLEQLRAGLTASSAPEAPFAPGETYHYSNLAYGLLGAVVAQVGGGSWWEQLGERVLTPLGMLRTSYDAFDPHAQGWSTDPWTGQPAREPHTDTGAMAPAGQLWSTVMDLSTLADVLVGGHRGVLRTETLDEMCTPRTGTARDGLALAYGLGVRLFPGGSGTLVGHTGSMPGFQAALLVDRERHAAAVVLANSTTGLASADLCRDLLDLLEHNEPRVRPAWSPPPAPSETVRRVLGVWHWGNTALGFTWDGRDVVATHLGADRAPAPYARWREVGDVLVGVSGHHHGEALQHHRSDSGGEHLVSSTFVFTRSPYDPAAPIPGGPPDTGAQSRPTGPR